jgi:thiol:disulfide interchange protein DsbD
MPKGDKHHDDFFGEVETYRERLQATLPGTPTEAAGTISLEVRYQGCADAGVCYPPQKRVVQVTLPGAGAAAAVPAARAGAASPFNNPLAGAGNSGGLRLPGAASNSQPCRCRRNRRSASMPSPVTATPCCCASARRPATTCIATAPR